MAALVLLPILLFLQSAQRECCVLMIMGSLPHHLFKTRPYFGLVKRHRLILCGKCLRGSPFLWFPPTLHIVPSMDYRPVGIRHRIKRGAALHPDSSLETCWSFLRLVCATLLEFLAAAARTRIISSCIHFVFEQNVGGVGASFCELPTTAWLAFHSGLRLAACKRASAQVSQAPFSFNSIFGNMISKLNFGILSGVFGLIPYDPQAAH